jgi:hypothetical protein
MMPQERMASLLSCPLCPFQFGRLHEDVAVIECRDGRDADSCVK